MIAITYSTLQYNSNHVCLNYISKIICNQHKQHISNNSKLHNNNNIQCHSNTRFHLLT